MCTCRGSHGLHVHVYRQPRVTCTRVQAATGYMYTCTGSHGLHVHVYRQPRVTCTRVYRQPRVLLHYVQVKNVRNTELPPELAVHMHLDSAKWKLWIKARDILQVDCEHTYVHTVKEAYIVPSGETALEVLSSEGILTLLLDLVYVPCNTQHGLVRLTETAVCREIRVELLHQLLHVQQKT